MNKREPRLKYLDLHNCSRRQLYSSVFKRDSFFKLYKVLHNMESDRVKERIGYILRYGNLYEFEEEIRLCFDAGLQSGSQQTYYFNTYLINLVELMYSNLSFSLRIAREVEAKDLVINLPTSISYDWVLFSSMLNRYQRYLLFEFLVLGYTITELAKRRYCTPRTIYNHFDNISTLLGS